MSRFEKLVHNIYRLCVPFEDIYTSVFAVFSNDEWVIADSGSNAEDVKNHIFPAIDELRIKPDWLISSHSHGDHNGGLETLAGLFPKAKIGMFDESQKEKYPECHIFSDGEIICHNLKLLNLKGHTPDSMAILDMRTNTVLTFDCVQLFGVGRYGTGIKDLAEYFKSLKRLKELRPENLIASHDYVPLGFAAWGEKAVLEYIDEAKNDALKISEFVKVQKDFEPEKILELYNRENKKLPPVGKGTIRAFKDYIKL